MKKVLEEMCLSEEDFLKREDEKIYYGKGKTDDITASVYWIGKESNSSLRRWKYIFA